MAAPGTSIYQGFATTGAHALVTAHAAELSGIIVTNANVAVRYFQVWDRATDLSGGEVGTNTTGAYPPSSLTVVSFLVPAGTAAVPFVLEIQNFLGDSTPLRFYNGIAWGFSSAAQTFTAGTAGDHSVSLRWRAA